MEFHDDSLVGAKVLVIDDEELVCRAMERQFRPHKITVFCATTAEEGINVLKEHDIDVVILDMKMPSIDGLEVLSLIKERWSDIPVIMMTAYGTIPDAVKAMKLGAMDFIQKPFDPPELPVIMVSKGVQQKRLMQRFSSLQREVEERYRFENIVGKSPKMQEIFNTITKLAGSESTVLIRGESGTGKELIARAIHYNSPRKKGPFVEVDLGALAENIIESELFGHVKGSFTGALMDNKGLFRAADNGTIFLDEVGNIPLAVQARLLRVLQEREVKPVGSYQPIRVNVRVIAATNKNLEDCVKKGEFREDLYFRLKVVPIEVPPLRERREDIPLLIQHFIAKHGGEGATLKFSPQATELLTNYDWPGNVRELENLIERLIALTGGDTMIKESDLPVEIKNFHYISSSTPISLDVYEKAAVERALAEAQWDVERASKILDVGKSTLYRKMKVHGITLPRKKKSDK